MLQQQIEGKYEVLGQVEEDGIGEVYKIRHLFLDEVRQIRVVRPHMVMTEEATKAFLQEARVVIKLRHPNIAQLHDFTIDEGGNAFIVNEFIEGVSLEEALAKEGPPPVRMVVRLAQQALRGLGYLHRAGLVHREVSPEKLVLTRDVDGQPLVKWVDLGLAKVLAAGDEPSPAGMFPPNPRYASPEQFGFSGSGEMDARSDLYSFGVVLYELLTGRCPVTGHDPFSYMAGHLSSSPLDFSESDPEGLLPGELRVAVLQTLAKRPEERIASADELARRLTILEDRLPGGGDEYLEKALRHARKRVVPVPPQPAPPPPARPAPIPAPVAALPAAALPASPPPPRPSPVVVAAPPAPPEPTLPPQRPLRPAPLAADWAERKLDSVEPLHPDPPPQAAILREAPSAPVPVEATSEEKSRTRERILAAAAVVLVVVVLGGGIWMYANPSQPERTADAETEAGAQPAAAPAVTETIEVAAEPVANPEEPVRPAPVSKPAPRPVEPARTVAPPAAAPEQPVRQEFPPPPAAIREAQRPPVRTEPATQANPGAGFQRGQMITGGPGVEHAEVGRLAEPAYPQRARGTGRRPSVRVAILVDENGNVLQTRILEGDPSGLGFNEAALEAARRTRFLPATKDGVPGKAWTDLSYEFTDPGLPAAAAPPPAVAAPVTQTPATLAPVTQAPVTQAPAAPAPATPPPAAAPVPPPAAEASPPPPQP
jgi:TonB family protein